MQQGRFAPDRLLNVLDDPLLWDTAPLIDADEVASIIAEVDAEEESASALCDTLLTGSSSTWPARFGETPETRDPAVVGQLLARVPDLFERRPADALQATSIAMAIAETLHPQKFWPDSVVIARGQALRDHAWVLMKLERYAEALPFAEDAERTFAQTDAFSLDLAQLAMVKAVVLTGLHRREEALEPIARAKEIYNDVGERRRYVEVCFAEAALLAEISNAARELKNAGRFRGLAPAPAPDADPALARHLSLLRLRGTGGMNIPHP
jgi:tetratricopeptide (TPR) repeat protein